MPSRRRGPGDGEAAGGAYWSLETNTPFHGWGSAGRLETTALAVLALAAAEDDDVAAATLRDRGVLFLLKQKDRYGVWQSTHATLSTVEALLAVLSRRNDPPASSSFEVLVDGRLR